METGFISSEQHGAALGSDTAEPAFAMPEGLPLQPVKNYLVQKDGHVYAGTHILIDFWHGVGLDDEAFIESTLREAAHCAEATVLHVHVHRFSEGGGVSGVAVLAESHISIHTWPEIRLATLDVFMCGTCRPELAVEHLERCFQPAHIDRRDCRRGMVE